MVNRLLILMGFVALMVALAGCGDAGYEPTPSDQGFQVPVGEQLVTSQPEGFNTIGGSATVNDAAYDLTFFQHYGVNPFIDTEDDNLSTFAMDVDTASYTVARRFVQDDNMPDPDSVRVEELVNYFAYGYETPEPLSSSSLLAPSMSWSRHPSLAAET